MAAAAACAAGRCIGDAAGWEWVWGGYGEEAGGVSSVG
jgi:hypothetical protein